MRAKLAAATHIFQPTAPGSAAGLRRNAVETKTRKCKNPRRSRGLSVYMFSARPLLLLLMLSLLVANGCRMFSQPMNLPPQVKIPQSMRLPDTHQVTMGQLVFHSDFELSADHRLLRQLRAE